MAKGFGKGVGQPLAGAALVKASGRRFTALLEHDGRKWAAILRWKAGHGGPAEVAASTESGLRFRLQSLDPTLKFAASRRRSS
jgi:hypothetical protein